MMVSKLNSLCVRVHAHSHGMHVCASTKSLGEEKTEEILLVSSESVF